MKSLFNGTSCHLSEKLVNLPFFLLWWVGVILHSIVSNRFEWKLIKRTFELNKNGSIQHSSKIIGLIKH